MLPAGLLVKVLSDPGEGLHSHQTGHVHLLHVVRGRQHDLVGVGLEARRRRRRRDADKHRRETLSHCGHSLSVLSHMTGPAQLTLLMANAMMMSDSLWMIFALPPG